VLALEHVGSTAVPGLAAKPIIDCDIVVDADDVDAAARVLVSLGFAPLGELGISERWAFREPSRLAGTNTYVIVAGSLSLRNHLCVRDTLRADDSLRDNMPVSKGGSGRRQPTLRNMARGTTPLSKESWRWVDSLPRSVWPSTAISLDGCGRARPVTQHGLREAWRPRLVRCGSRTGLVSSATNWWM
jgi:hypothetical protein